MGGKMPETMADEKPDRERRDSKLFPESR